MSEVTLFGIGSIIFMVTTWATFSFGLRRMGQLQAQELERANRTAVAQPSGLTEIHVEKAPTDKDAAAN